VAWLNRLLPCFPASFSAMNARCDARHVVRVQGGKVEKGIGVRNDRLDWSWRLAQAGRSMRALARAAEGFRTEVQQAAQGFIRSLAGVLEKA